MTTARIDRWIWLLIYGGMILIALGLSALRSDTSLGWGIAAVGIVLATIGAGLIWVRSRMNETKGSTP